LQKAAEFLDNPKVATKYSKKQLLAGAAASFYHVNFEERYPEQAIAGLINVLEHNHDHYSKMIANLLPILQMLTSDTLKELLSPDEQNSSIPIFDNKAFLEEQMVVCIGLDSLSDSTVGKSVGSLLLADLASVAGERFNFTDPKLMKPINIFVDEACEVLNEPFIQLLNKGRGAAMRLFVATQNISDFSAVMGSEARANQILGNINNKFALRTNDKKTMDYLSEHMPMTTVKYVQRGQSFGASADTPLKHQGHLDERLMEKDQALFPPQLFSLIPNLEYIAFISGGTTIKGRIPIIIRDEANVAENPIKIVPSIDEDYIKGLLVSDKVAGLNSTDWDEYVKGSPEQPGQHEGQKNIDGQLQAKQENLSDVEIWGAPVQFQQNETAPQEQSKLEAEA
ncbi:MAG: TraM recognition domain-containing protein, partial [Burkholderiales bacterium]|nr:TraM recognition domain-containing protein [Burkholderiales bacterium]